MYGGGGGGGGFLGNDPASMQECSTSFTNAASDIEASVSQVDSAVAAVQWNGSDRDQFEQSWQGEIRTQINNAVETLNQASQQLQQQAEQQIQASSG